MTDALLDPPPFRFDQSAPGAALADLVGAIWTARGRVGYGRERILPSADPVLVINLGSPFRVRASASLAGDGFVRKGWLVGPQSAWVENEPMAETDVEVAPKKTYVSLRRSKQFALIKPATQTRVEVGLNLPGAPGTERLVPTTGMCSHIVRVGSSEELDEELRGWLAAAHERA